MSGSSPRPWGTQSAARHALPLVRFIPTPVGNTLDLRLDLLQLCGSSPRPWGTLMTPLSPSIVERFIPTPVGNTWAASRRATCWTVHPHARGEHCTYLR